MKKIILNVNGKQIDILVPPDDVERIVNRIESKEGAIITNLWNINFKKDKVSLVEVINIEE